MQDVVLAVGEPMADPSREALAACEDRIGKGRIVIVTGIMCSVVVF